MSFLLLIPSPSSPALLIVVWCDRSKSRGVSRRERREEKEERSGRRERKSRKEERDVNPRIVLCFCHVVFYFWFFKKLKNLKFLTPWRDLNSMQVVSRSLFPTSFFLFFFFFFSFSFLLYLHLNPYFVLFYVRCCL